MAQAQDGDTVKVHYRGTLDNGQAFDDSHQGDPFEFTIGNEEVIPGFEEAVRGMSPEEEKTITIEAAEAYGPRRDDLVMEVDRSNFQEDADFEVGHRVQIQPEEGQQFVAMITNLSEDSVTLDANHPLAGQDLTFEVELLEIA
ncbi:MAG: peptidylprolyl isomerase [Candidatus Brocadiia bacterium]|nr:peptidylprolyl isomerase [Planctomycetota bacterium]